MSASMAENVLLRNLRFLDLDRLPDWSGIASDTFGFSKAAGIGQKDRIRAAEWLLYRLFELWDPVETKATIRQYFPALEPLQSIKLRAALLAWLSRLKANSVLGRECMIRKSMLDDCKGDKFVEVLLHFSTAVLRKVVQKRNGAEKSQPRALRMGLGHSTISAWESAALLYALEVSTRETLAARHAREVKLRELEKCFTDRSLAIEQDFSSIGTGRRSVQTELLRRDIDPTNMKKQIRYECCGNPGWLSVALSGDPDHDRDVMLEDSFEKVWHNAFNTNSETAYDILPTGMLADLEQRVVDQQNRLVRWRAFQKELSLRNEQSIVASPAKTPFRSAQRSKFASPRTNTLKRAATTRRPPGSALRPTKGFQPMQSTPSKPPTSHRIPPQEARGEQSPPGPELDLLDTVSPQDPSVPEQSSTRSPDIGSVCDDMADLKLSTSSSNSPSVRNTTFARPSRLPSPTKSPVRQAAAGSPCRPSLERNASSASSGSQNRSSVPGVAILPSKSSSDDQYLPVDVPDPSCLSAQAQTNNAASSVDDPQAEQPGFETLSERTQRTMAEWQQQQQQHKVDIQARPTSSGSMSSSSKPTTRPKTLSRPRTPKSTSYGASSPQRSIMTTPKQRVSPTRRPTMTAQHSSSGRSPTRRPEFTLHDSPPGTAEASMSTAGAQEQSTPLTSPTSFSIRMLASPEAHRKSADSRDITSTVAPQLATPMPATPASVDTIEEDEMSAFKPRNRLRRSPPGTPSPWA